MKRSTLRVHSEGQTLNPPSKCVGSRGKMATNYPVNQNTDRDKSDEAGIGVDQIDAENVVPAKSKTKANKPREKVGSYTQLLRQHQRKSPREMVILNVTTFL